MRYSLQLIKPTKSILKLLPTAADYTVIFDANKDGYYYYRVIIPESKYGDSSVLNEIFPHLSIPSYENILNVDDYCEQVEIGNPFTGYSVLDFNRNGETIVTTSYIQNDSYYYFYDGILPMAYLSDSVCFCIPLKLNGASCYWDVDFPFIFHSVVGNSFSKVVGGKDVPVNYANFYDVNVSCVDYSAMHQPAGLYEKINDNHAITGSVALLLKPLK